MNLAKSLEYLEIAYESMYVGKQESPSIVELRRKITDTLFELLSKEDFFRMFSSIGSSIDATGSRISIPYQLNLELAWEIESRRLESLKKKPTLKTQYSWEDSNRGVYSRNLINESVWGFKEWQDYQTLLFPAEELSENSDEGFLLLRERANSRVRLYHFEPVLWKENPFVKVDPNSKLEFILNYQGEVPLISKPMFEYFREIEQNELPKAKRNIVWIKYQDDSLFNAFYEGIKRYSQRCIEDLQEKKGKISQEKLQAVYNALILEPSGLV